MRKLLGILYYILGKPVEIFKQIKEKLWNNVKKKSKGWENF